MEFGVTCRSQPTRRFSTRVEGGVTIHWATSPIIVCSETNFHIKCLLVNSVQKLFSYII